MPKEQIIAEIRARSFDPEIAVAQAQAESAFNPNAIGPMTRYGRAKGLFQFIDATWQQYAPGQSVFDPVAAIAARNAYMRDLYAMFGGDAAKALAGYNWGQGNVRNAISKWGNDWFRHAPLETRNYVTKILNNAGGNFTRPLARTPGAKKTKA